MSRGFDRHGRWTLAALLLVALTLAAAFPLVGCGPAPAGRYGPTGTRYPLEAWVTVAQDATGALQPQVRVSVPYHSLVFHRQGHRFHSGFEVQVVARRDGDQVGGGVGRVRVDLATFAETETEATLTTSAPLQIRGNQTVALEVTVSVLESSRTWWRDLRFSPHSLAAMPIWIVAVNTGLPTASTGDGLMLADTDSLRLEVTLQRRPEVTIWPQDELNLVSKVTAAALGQPLRLLQPVTGEVRPEATVTLTQIWATSQLPFGRCRVQTQLELARGGEWLILPREPALELVNLQVALPDDDVWQRQVEWLEDGLTEAARDSLLDLDPHLRPAAWADIWRRRALAEGLTPVQAERRHLLRIVAADDRFGGHRRGALSDRGRTLIRWGEPARVQTYPDARTPGAVWEVWEYPMRQRRVLFFDAHGMGDFKIRGDESLLD